MQLLTNSLHSKLPPLYAAQNDADPTVWVKFFTPDSNWTWFVLEGSPVNEDGVACEAEESVDYMFFGLVKGFEDELGYFTLSELEGARGPLGLAIERDLHFTPKPLSQVK